jgi:hypothetical protein
VGVNAVLRWHPARCYDARAKEMTMIELTEQQQQALDAESEPRRLVDPRSQTTYVLVRADIYERPKSLLEDDDFHPRDAYPAIDKAFAEGWNDPKMDDYDRYEELRP